MALRKIALITAQESPLAQAGNADCGEQNIDMAHVARRLAQLGHAVDVFTRLDKLRGDYVQAVDDGYRVVHVPAGPVGAIAREQLLLHMEEFADFMADFFTRESRFGEPYDVIHANFLTSGMAGLALRKQFGVPLVMTFHAQGEVRRLPQGTADGLPAAGFAIEDRLMRDSDVLIAACPQDFDNLMRVHDADAKRIAAVPHGIDGLEFYPVDLIAARRALGWEPEQLIVLQTGSRVSRKRIGNVIGAIAQVHRRYGARAQADMIGTNSPAVDARSAMAPGIVSTAD